MGEGEGPRQGEGAVEDHHHDVDDGQTTVEGGLRPGREAADGRLKGAILHGGDEAGQTVVTHEGVDGDTEKRAEAVGIDGRGVGGRPLLKERIGGQHDHEGEG